MANASILHGKKPCCFIRRALLSHFALCLRAALPLRPPRLHPVPSVSIMPFSVCHYPITLHVYMLGPLIACYIQNAYTKCFAFSFEWWLSICRAAYETDTFGSTQIFPILCAITRIRSNTHRQKRKHIHTHTNTHARVGWDENECERKRLIECHGCTNFHSR